MTDGCPGTNRNGNPCGHPEGWGTDKEEGPCKFHGGASTGPKTEEGKAVSSQNAVTHGAFREHFRSDLTDDEVDAIDDLVGHLREITDERAIPAEVAAEALMKYKRSADSRFLREARQWLAEFNIIDNVDEQSISGAGIVIHTEADGDE